jgi:glycosyltransferase involved in cell wall biosynthesis
MPELVKKFPDLKFILTGGGFKKKIPWLINKNIVSKKELYNLIYNSVCMCVPLKFGSGTRVKIIEALSIGSIVVSSKKGIEGIELLRKNPPYIFNNTKNFLEILIKVIKNNKKIKNNAYKDRNYYLKKYSMKNNTSIFLKKINL